MALQRLPAIISYQHSVNTRDKSIDMDFSISPFQMLLSRKAKHSLIALRAVLRSGASSVCFFEPTLPVDTVVNGQG